PVDVTGAILVSGVVLALVGLLIHVLGADAVNRVLPPVVTGAVVMLIGFNLAGVATDVYLPTDPWIAMLTMTVVVLMAVGLKGFLGRIAIFIGLVFGYLVSWLADVVFGQITSPTPSSGGEAITHDRVDWSSVSDAAWFGLPPHTADGLTGNQALADNLDAVGWHLPSFSITFALLALPAVIALVAENIGHVKAVSGMTGVDLDPVVGRAVAADGIGTVITSTVGGSPTTTDAENIGVMAATRVYSTAAYYVAAVVAILLGLVPKFGAIVAATPAGVLAGITLVLYGMIGLHGARIWIENNVNFSDPANLVPIGAGLILGIGYGTTGFFSVTDDFQLGGIALGTIVIVAGYHLARWVEPRGLEGAPMSIGAPGAYTEDHAAPHHRDHD
ncbi:MAG: uracil-xanthine permease family protein, partial [Nocardioides sp.]